MIRVQMRDFITMTEDLIRNGIFEDVGEPLLRATAEPPAPSSPSVLLEELNDLVFKLRAFTDTNDDVLAEGIEVGMQRAADMIENMLNRHKEG
jgi:hypothetical protein